MPSLQIIRGVNVFAVVQMNSNQMKFRFKSLRVEEEAESGYDNYGGETRGRPYKVTNGFKFTYETDHENQAIFTQWLAWIANADANLAPFVNVIGVVFKFKDGTKAAYKISGNVTPGELSIGYGSRAAAVNSPSYFRAQFFDAVPAV